MNGQIQYGSARPLTSHATRIVRGRPTADPNRFPSTHGTSRPVALLFGASLLLGGLLTAAPQEILGVAVSVVLGGIWLSLVLAMALPSESERSGQELVRRLAQFRHELHTIGDAPTEAALERLMLRARELGLRDDEVGEELAEVRACADALALKARLASGEAPLAEPPDPLPPGDTCHFLSPVRFGRRRADQFGRLVLTSACLKFLGALDVSVAWSEVSSVRRDRREILVGLQDSRRVLRFSCQSLAEAAKGGVIAEHFSQAARADVDSSSQCHAPI